VLIEPPTDLKIQIIEKNEDYEEYVENKFPVYKSKTVLCRQLLCVGKIFKKCNSLIAYQ